MGKHSKIVRRDDVAGLALVDAHQMVMRHKTGDPQSQEILMTIPVDFHYWVSVSSGKTKREIEILTAFEMLLNHLRLNPVQKPSPQQSAELGLLHLRLQNWQRAISWCLHFYIESPLNEHPFGTKEYKAFQKFGEAIYAKFKFIRGLFKAFESLDYPLPFPQRFGEMFLCVMVEDINLSLHEPFLGKRETTKAGRQWVKQLRQKENPYGDASPNNKILLETAYSVMANGEKDSPEVKRLRLSVRKAYDLMIKEYASWNDHVDRNKTYGFCAAYPKDGQIFMPVQRAKKKPASSKVKPQKPQKSSK